MIRISAYTKVNDNPANCIVSDCQSPLPEEPDDYTEHTDWDEDRGMVTDTYEIRNCPKCGEVNISFLHDRPA